MKQIYMNLFSRPFTHEDLQDLRGGRRGSGCATPQLTSKMFCSAKEYEAYPDCLQDHEKESRSNMSQAFRVGKGPLYQPGGLMTR